MGPKILGLYINNSNNKLYRVLGMIEDKVLYISEDKKLYLRPMSNWFGTNRQGYERFSLVEDDCGILMPEYVE